MKSWQTTIAGIIAVLCGAILIGIKFNRGESLTEIEWATIGGLLAAGYGLFRARDNDKTSEQMKDGRSRTDFVRPKILLALCALPILLLAGCQSSTPTETLGGQSLDHITMSLFSSDVTADSRKQYGGNLARDDGAAGDESEVDADGEPVTVEDLDPETGQVIRRTTFTRGKGSPIIFGDVHQIMDVWNDAAGTAQSRTDQARSTAIAPQVQANTGGAAGTQGDSTTSSNQSSTDATETDTDTGGAAEADAE
jgi:hypothetical protein